MPGAIAALDEAGAIDWAKDGSTAIDALVADWRADLEAESAAETEAGGLASRLVVVPRNAQARDLNWRLQSVMFASGRLKGRPIALRALQEDGQVRVLDLQPGDRVVFNDTIAAHGIADRDFGTVEVAERLPDGEARLRVRLDKGGIVDAPVSELVGFRERNDPLRRTAPALAHGYAVTARGPRLRPVQRCYLLATEMLDRWTVKAALGLHRGGLRFYADTARLCRGLGAVTTDFARRALAREAWRSGNTGAIRDYFGPRLTPTAGATAAAPVPGCWMGRCRTGSAGRHRWICDRAANGWSRQLHGYRSACRASSPRAAAALERPRPALAEDGAD